MPFRGPTSLKLCCFTNGCYTLPPFLSIFFFFFHWQKSHWRKLTYKVDSSLCLKTSVMPLPSPVPIPNTTSSHPAPSALSTCPWARCLVGLCPPATWTGVQAHRNTSDVSILYPCLWGWGANVSCVCVLFLTGHFVLFIISHFWNTFRSTCRGCMQFVPIILHECPSIFIWRGPIQVLVQI